MAKQHMIIQSDHMSSKTADAAISIAARLHYAGVVSAHCCSSPQLFQRIYATGGYVNPPVGPGTAFVGKWKADKAVRTRRYSFGFGWGSDMNGLAAQPGPTAPSIKYPFKSVDGHVKFSREKWGVRTFDYNKEGVATTGSTRTGSPTEGESLCRQVMTSLLMKYPATGVLVQRANVCLGDALLADRDDWVGAAAEPVRAGSYRCRPQAGS